LTAYGTVRALRFEEQTAPQYLVDMIVYYVL
jgi:hypothetical protein